MALNNFVGMGRITAQPEQKQTTTGKSVVAFSIAIDRNYKTQDGQKVTDFLNCVAYEKTAEMITRYFNKGSMICVEGSVQTRSWQSQDGTKRHTTEIIVDRVHFTGEKATDTAGQNSAPTAQPAAPAVPAFAAPSVPKFETAQKDDDLPF